MMSFKFPLWKGIYKLTEQTFSRSCSAIFGYCFLLNWGLILDFESRYHFGWAMSSREANMKSLLWPAFHHILQWLLGSLCEPPNWLYGPCTKYLISMGSISSQRPAFFFVTLLSRSTIRRYTEIRK